MKNVLFVFLSILFFSCSEDKNVEIGQKTSIQINPIFDGGKVLLGEEIHATFKVKNDGKYPLIISEVKGSCSCTIADYPDEPISPGKTETIYATVKTENASVGMLSKEVRVVANTDPSITVLKINAEVIRK
ncbi:MAG: DUF1573 domain-containing protein [Flavobacteriia bacterium]|nr:DUF1573 domain-containing protein [Flavobacteriia bacterium]